MKFRGWAPLYDPRRSKIRTMLTKQRVDMAGVTKIFNALDHQKDQINLKFRDAIKAHPKWQAALLRIGDKAFEQEIVKIAEKVDVRVHWIEQRTGHGHFKLTIDGSDFPIFDVEI